MTVDGGESTGPDGIAPALEAEGPTGFVQIPDHVLMHPQLDGDAVRLYGIIKHFAGQSGAAWPGRKKLAERMCVKSARTVDKYLTQLIDTGYLVITKRFRTPEYGFHGGDGAQTSNHYLLRWNPKMPPDEGHKANPQVTPPSKNLHGGASKDLRPPLADSCDPPSQGFASQEPQPPEPEVVEPEDDDERLSPPIGATVDNRMDDGFESWPRSVRELMQRYHEQVDTPLVWRLTGSQLTALDARIRDVMDVQPFIDAALSQDAAAKTRAVTVSAFLPAWSRLRRGKASTAAPGGVVPTARKSVDWCGECDESRHLVDDDGVPTEKCPRCHPAMTNPAF